MDQFQQGQTHQHESQSFERLVDGVHGIID